MPALDPAPTPSWHPWFFARLGLAGLGLPWTCSPSTCALGRVGSPLSLLRLGLSSWLGFGTRSASQVGRILASYTYPSCFLGAVDMDRERQGLPAHQIIFLSLAAARASLFGVFARSWGLESNRHGVRLLVSARLHPPVRHCLVSLFSFHPISSKGCPPVFRVYFLTTHPSASRAH